MGIIGHEDIAKCEQEIRLWFDNRGLPFSIYSKITQYFKELVQKSVCIPTKEVSNLQRRELYDKLYSFVEFRNSGYNPSNSMTDDDLRSFFSPLSERQKMPKDDWGG